MSQPKPVFVFVVEDKLGGVAYFNKNIIDNSSLKSFATVKVVLVDRKDSTHERFKDDFDANELVNFRYDSRENKIAVLKRLAKVIGDEPGALICNDSLEMEAVHIFPTDKTVYQIIHDYYNLTLAVRFGAIVDVFLAHTELFSEVLRSAAPTKNNSFHLPHGVRILPWQAKSSNGMLKIVFAGRLVEGKGVQDLYEIDQLLKCRNIVVEWTIIGRGPLKQFLTDQWKEETNITFFSPDNNLEVYQEMLRNDLFVLPTRFEGSPVTVLEALSCGLIPIVSDLPGGIREIIKSDIGNRIPVGDKSGFASAIAGYNNERQLLAKRQMRCRQLAEDKFDIEKTADNYFRCMMQYQTMRQRKYPFSQSIGSRLDKAWIPNWLVFNLRKVF